MFFVCPSNYQTGLSFSCLHHLSGQIMLNHLISNLQSEKANKNRTIVCVSFSKGRIFWAWPPVGDGSSQKKIRDRRTGKDADLTVDQCLCIWIAPQQNTSSINSTRLPWYDKKLTIILPAKELVNTSEFPWGITNMPVAKPTNSSRYSQININKQFTILKNGIRIVSFSAFK